MFGVSHSQDLASQWKPSVVASAPIFLSAMETIVLDGSPLLSVCKEGKNKTLEPVTLYILLFFFERLKAKRKRRRIGSRREKVRKETTSSGN